MVECGRCKTNVVPQKKTSIGWIIFWVIIFWPAAIIYALTRKDVSCPRCGANVYAGY